MNWIEADKAFVVIVIISFPRLQAEVNEWISEYVIFDSLSLYQKPSEQNLCWYWRGCKKKYILLCNSHSNMSRRQSQFSTFRFLD